MKNTEAKMHDTCGACGHERLSHDRNGCDALVHASGAVPYRACECTSFVSPSPAGPDTREMIGAGPFSLTR